MHFIITFPDLNLYESIYNLIYIYIEVYMFMLITIHLNDTIGLFIVSIFYSYIKE